MNNYINIKITLLQHGNKPSELYFDYCNKDGQFVGNIIVNTKGKIEWHILDATYQNEILNAVVYINNNDTNILLDYEEDDFDKKRWNNAIFYAIARGIHLNIKTRFNNLDAKVKKYHR